MKVRNAEIKDIPELIELLHQVLEIHAHDFPEIFKSGTTKYTEKDLEKIIVDPEKQIFVAADEDDKCVGYAFTVFEHHPETNNTYAEDVLYLDDLCVSYQCRGQHVGRLLFDRVREYAQEKNCRRITLNVWEHNDNARAFYDRMGMRPVKTMMEYPVSEK